MSSTDQRKASETSAPEAAALASDLASSASSLSLREAFQKNTYIIELERWLPHLVSQYPFDLRNEIAKYLDLPKEQGNDWRLVSSKLNFENNFIEKIKGDQSPTQRLLGNCTNITTGKFLAVLNDPKVRRKDVIAAMWEFVQPPGMRERSPTQETVSSNWSSSPSGSFDREMPHYDHDLDSGIDSKPTMGRQPSEQDAEDEIPPHMEFFSDASKEFWKSVPGSSVKEKNWSDFIQAIKNSDFGEELKAGAVDRFLCYVLKLDYGGPKEQVVTLDNFLHLVGWFGPFCSGGCLTKMDELMKGSVSNSPDGTKQSWFAGYQELEQDQLKLRDQKPGCFLIRFSTSRADDGYFSLAVKTNTGVESFQIEASPSDCSHLTLADQTYEDLLKLVADLRNNIRLEQCQIFLNNPCPNLPLNAIFKGYTSTAGVSSRLRGRGRGRGRSRNIQQS